MLDLEILQISIGKVQAPSPGAGFATGEGSAASTNSEFISIMIIFLIFFSSFRIFVDSSLA